MRACEYIFGFGRSRSWGDRRQFYVIYMDILKKTTKNVTVVQRYKNPGLQVARATNTCTMAHNTGWSKSIFAPAFCNVIIRCTETFWSLCIRGPSVWKWLYVTFLVPRILRCTLAVVCSRVPVLPYVSVKQGTVNRTVLNPYPAKVENMVSS